MIEPHEPREISAILSSAMDTIVVPTESVLKAFEQDYATMSEFMIYGESLSFPELIQRLEILQERIRQMG